MLSSVRFGRLARTLSEDFGSQSYGRRVDEVKCGGRQELKRAGEFRKPGDQPAVVLAVLSLPQGAELQCTR